MADSGGEAAEAAGTVADETQAVNSNTAVEHSEQHYKQAVNGQAAPGNKPAASGPNPAASGSSGGGGNQQGTKDKPKLPRPEGTQACPRCSSEDTKFCYYNNYNIKQPRYYCRSCQRYWTVGGTLRDVPVGAGRRKSKAASADAAAIPKPDMPAKRSSASSAQPAALPPQPGLMSAGPFQLGGASSMQLPIPLPPGLASMLPPLPPIMDPSMAAFGLPNLKFGAPMDPGSAGGAAAAGQLGRLGSFLSRGGGTVMPDPASAFQPVGPAGSSARGGAAAVTGPRPAQQPGDGGGDGDGETEQRVKRMRTDNGAATGPANVSEPPPPGQGLPPNSSAQPRSATDGSGTGMTGQPAYDWLSLAANQQHMLAANPYASVWPPYGSGPFAPSPWMPVLPSGGSMAQGQPGYGMPAAADAARMGMPPGSAPLGSQPLSTPPATQPQPPTPWPQSHVAGGALGMWGQLPGTCGGWGGGLLPPAPGSWPAMQPPLANPISTAAANLVAMPQPPPNLHLGGAGGGLSGLQQSLMGSALTGGSLLNSLGMVPNGALQQLVAANGSAARNGGDA